MARTAESILKSRERETPDGRASQGTSAIAEVRDHVQKAFIGYRQAMYRVPVRYAATIAAELGVDVGKLEKLMRGQYKTNWRRSRHQF